MEGRTARREMLVDNAPHEIEARNPPREISLRGLSIIVPAFNEEKGITGVLAELNGLRERVRLPLEILVVDDGSSDRTADHAEAVPGIRVIRHRTNRGYGASLKTGIRRARYPLVCITDADGTYPNERIPDLVAQYSERDADMIVGARTGSNVAIPWVRRPAKWAIGRLAEYVAGEPIPDLNSGLRLFSRELALRFFNLLPDGFSFTTTISLAMLSNGFSVHYVSIDYHARTGRSKIRPIHDTLNFVHLVLRMALYFAPLRMFLPAAGVLVLTAIGMGVFARFVLGELPDVSTLVLAVTGIQIGAIGLLAELINRRLPNVYRDG